MTPLVDNLLNGASSVFSLLWGSFILVLRYPLEPTSRLFVPYVLTSLLLGAAFFAFQRRRGTTSGPRGPAEYFRALFPREIWRHESAKVDVRYFLPHQMLRIWIYGPFMAGGVFIVANATHQLFQRWIDPEPVFQHSDSLWTRIAITIVIALATDFSAYASHVAQHKIPFLWEFHRVHHSALVLNPLSNYREHPIDNLFYALVISLGLGLAMGCMLALFGEVPTQVGIAGVALPILAFNVFGNHLRHSHIWIRWPDPLALLFGSPAHHQIHHSCKAEHVDKNFAFLFPFWDRMFGTYVLPKQRPEMIMGLGDGTESQYSGFAKIYALPFLRLGGRPGEPNG